MVQIQAVVCKIAVRTAIVAEFELSLVGGFPDSFFVSSVVCGFHLVLCCSMLRFVLLRVWFGGNETSLLRSPREVFVP